MVFRQATVGTENSVGLIIYGLIALEERPVLTYNLPTSHPQRGFILTWMELVAPEERPWNQALHVYLAAAR